MANDTPGAAPSATQPRETVRLDDLPTYRAISNQAVFSLLLGLVAIFSIASLWFLIAAVGAIAVGWLALRRINKFPDVYTGAGLARLGIGMGLVFGLGSTTSVFMQGYLLKSEAKRFAVHFAKELGEKDFNTLMWYRASPAARKGKSGAEVTQEIQSQTREGGMFESEFGALRACVEKIKGSQLDVEFLDIEQAGQDGLTPFAFALLELHDHKAANEAPTFVMVALKAIVTDGKYEWWVDRFVYPYQRGSMAAPTPKLDDGHGHSH